MEFTGEIFALATAFCWAFTTIFFAEAGKIIGSFKVNNIRLLLAAVIYTIILLITKGRIFPENLIGGHVFWLGLSGIIGFVIGDGAGFKALVMIGARLAVLVYSTAPIIATLIAWAFLGERLNLIDILGVVVTVGGIAWVVTARSYVNNKVDSSHPDSGSFGKGLFYAFIWGAGQAGGLVLSKHAMVNLAEPIEPMEASFLRIIVSVVVIWLLATVRGQFMSTVRGFTNRKAVGLMVAGAIAGPFAGVWMSLIAVKYIAVGIAATLNATVPIWLLPIVRVVYKERLSVRIVLGTIIAVAGIALLMVQ